MDKIGKLLSIIGIILIVVPIIGSITLHYKQERLYEEYLKENFQEIQENEQSNLDEIDKNKEELVNMQDKGNGNFEEESEKLHIPQKIQNKLDEDEKLVEDENTTISSEKLEAIIQGEVIGKIKIKAVDINLILLEGVSDHEIKLGAGHMKDTAWPGSSGNCVIAGHRNYTFGSMFNRLDEVKMENEINIEFLGNHYHYTVNEVKIVEPDDLSVLESDESKEELTLITCHPLYSGTHRLIIKGILNK